MKIGVFTYNFSHKKTYDGLLNMYLHGFKPEIIFAQNKIKLNIRESKIRINPYGLPPLHSQFVAEALDIPYAVLVHNSKDCEQLIKEYALDIGVILGARILKGNIIDAFTTGIINLHPGLIPFNRGLDNIKWAILNFTPQGVTTHFINEEIDLGLIIERKIMDVLPDDTLVDMGIRIQDLSQQMLITALQHCRAKNLENLIPPESKGKYYKPVPEDIESGLLEAFETYKKYYPNIKSTWEVLMNDP